MTENIDVTETPVAQDAFTSEIQQVTSPQTEAPATVTSTSGKTYTEEDLRKVREQEKNKLYPQIDGLKEELNLLKKEREEKLAEDTRRRAEAEAEAKRQAEAEMDVRTLLENKEREWQEQLDRERLEREQAFALLEKERSYAELTEYRNRRLAEEQDNIIPELLDLISGNTPQEIESSIAGLKERSSRILDSAQAAMQSARREMTGSRVTAPPTGPLDTNSEQNQFTAEQISAMSVSEYAKYRQKLLGQAASTRGKGLFG